MYFGENGIIKSAFHKNKRPININEVDIEEILLSHKKSYSKDTFKYFIGHRHKGNAFPSPLCVKLPQMNAYVKYFDKNNKYINLLVNDIEIMKREPVYNDKYIKTKIKIYNSKVQIFNTMKYPKIMNIVRAYL